jgi:Zn-finger nucleic acid-binding protein
MRKEMRESFHRNVEVDVCPKCGGLFLDKNEVQALTGSRRVHKLLTKYQGLDSNTQTLCPNCGGLMEADDVGNVRVDVCLECYGVWLEAGALEQLASMDRAVFRHLTSEQIEEFRKAKSARREDHVDAIRSLFVGLRRL